MLSMLSAYGFKSLAKVERVRLAPLTVLFGPNAAGKSNVLDAIQVLSRLASEKTVADALADPVRGLPLEAFTFPSEGLPGLLKQDKRSFALRAEFTNEDTKFEYAVVITIRPATGLLTVDDEYLIEVDHAGYVKGQPAIEKVEDRIRIRRRGKAARPRDEEPGKNYTHLSDLRFTGSDYRLIERARKELSSWRTYYLDPRIAMRSSRPPQEVDDIGPLGEHVAPYLYRLREERPKVFGAVLRTLRALIPSVEDLSVELDTKRGVLDIEIRQGGTAFSSRVVSEGTLRVLALACVVTNPWGGTLVSFEEPENGVHPRRIELIAQMLVSLATGPQPRRQVVVTTHSPIFCGAIIRHARENPDDIAIYRVARDQQRTQLTLFSPTGALFEDEEIAKALREPSEAGVFQGLALRGLLDD